MHVKSELSPAVIPMPVPLVLASGSRIRADLLRNAGLQFDIQVPRVDEEAVKQSLLAEAARPRDIADALAELKARRISDKVPGALVIGCDQVLEFENRLLSKPESADAALSQLRDMQGKRHTLLAAAVIVQDGQPIWRHVGQVRLQMRPLSERFLQSYVARNWDSIRHSVGAYKLEEEGVRLFSAVQGDYYTVLGIPLIELLNFLSVRGDIDT